jgi:hypothetical protein
MGIILPTINVMLFLLVATAFVLSHGGWVGDAEWTPGRSDTVSRPADKGLVVFNKWNFDGDQESLLTRGFLSINIAAFGAARLLLSILGTIWEQFQTSQPLGLSYASYTLILAIPFSLAQWVVIGLLLDWLRRRSAR